jgi:hypothetical protein
MDHSIRKFMEAIDSFRVSEKVTGGNEPLSEDGRIVDGVNTTVDVATDETRTQAAKFGNAVDAGGIPPSICETGETPTVSKKSPVPKDNRPGLNNRYKALFSRRKR